MSGYQVTTPAYFSVIDPQQQNQSRTIFLQRELFKPAQVNANSANSSEFTYTGTQLLAGYIVRNANYDGTVDDYLPTGEDIINVLGNFIWSTNGVTAPIQTNPDWQGNLVTNGMSFPFIIYNSGPSSINIQSNTNTNFVDGSWTLGSQQSLRLYVVVVDVVNNKVNINAY